MTLALAGDEPSGAQETRAANGELVPLPPPSTSSVRLDGALQQRRSVRDFSSRALSRAQLGQLCWAAQGITDPSAGLRTAPSAGALYPLELYVVLSEGLFHYEPRGHRLRRIDELDHRAGLARAALGQDAVRDAPADLVITAVVARTRAKYGARAERYVALEAGHAAQNVLLEASALGLGAVPIGAFDDDEVRRTLGIAKDQVPVYILPVGQKAR